jgi:ComF family protein
MSTLRALGELWRTAGNLVFPPVCVHCGGLVEGGGLRHLCTRCEPLLTFVQPPHCHVCGHPFHGEVHGERLCPHCVELEPEFREGRTCVLLAGPGRALVHALKYHRALYVLEDIAALIRATPGITGYLRGAALVPVPLHPRKERERGYNQSRLLAGCFAAAGGTDTRVEEPLRRVIDTPTQTAFDRRARQANLKNAFALRSGAAINPAERYVLIDVFTTGSTLNACAAVLRRAGCLNLDVVTFGHG